MTLRKPQDQPRDRQGVIDLHLHTTASDGRCTPEELVRRAADAGVTVLAVTDHDTTAAVREVRERAADRGIRAVPGIEITAVEQGSDVHVLGYFVDSAREPFQAFLSAQRRHRLDRARAIAARLARLGMPIDIERVLHDAAGGAAASGVSGGRSGGQRAVGRPQIARAMLDAGYVTSVTEAFDRWLGRDAPAFVPRAGAAPEEVIATIHRAGGLASLAHPSRTAIDGRIEALRTEGLDAIEVYHSDHGPAQVERYLEIAGTLELLVTGGSDFHGDPERVPAPGAATLPPAAWDRLEAASGRHA